MSGDGRNAGGRESGMRAMAIALAAIVVVNVVLFLVSPFGGCSREASRSRQEVETTRQEAAGEAMEAPETDADEATDSEDAAAGDDASEEPREAPTVPEGTKGPIQRNDLEGVEYLRGLGPTNLEGLDDALMRWLARNGYDPGVTPLRCVREPEQIEVTPGRDATILYLNIVPLEEWILCQCEAGQWSIVRLTETVPGINDVSVSGITIPRTEVPLTDVEELDMYVPYDCAEGLFGAWAAYADREMLEAECDWMGAMADFSNMSATQTYVFRIAAPRYFEGGSDLVYFTCTWGLETGVYEFERE